MSKKASNKIEGLSDDDFAVLDELVGEHVPEQVVTYTPKQERIVAGFEEVQRFVVEHGRLPEHGEDRDIFERLYAVRLERMRSLKECREVLEPLDTGGLLGAAAEPAATSEEDALAELGMAGDDAADVTVIRHVRPAAERRSPDEVAKRKPCEDFASFAADFNLVQRELSSKLRRTVPFKERNNQSIERGDWFILDGQKAYVAEASEPFLQDYGERDRRLRVIFDNATESDLLLRSLRRALNKDAASRRILPPDDDVGPLFSDQAEDGDVGSGHIYVLRSKSDHPFIAEHRQTIHKIGVTGGDVKRRIAGARKDPTFLLADVELVDSYTLANVNRTKLERLLHGFFAETRIDVTLKDRFDGNVQPREWFIVPLPAIAEAVGLLRSGDLVGRRYDTKSGTIVADPARSG